MMRKVATTALFLMLSSVVFAASTFSPNLQLENCTPGDATCFSTWGTKENTARSMVDSYTAGILSVNVPGHAGYPTIILSVQSGALSESLNRIYILTGALTQNTTILWPQSLPRFFTVTNSTTGAFSMTLGANNGSGAAAGTTQTIAQGQTLSFYSDGTNVLPLSSITAGPAGGVLSGNYPNPGMAAGAAATNVGSLGGDLSGTLPNPTVAKVNTQPFAATAPPAVGAEYVWTGTTFSAAQQKPAFRAKPSATQTVSSSGTALKIAANTVTFDTTSNYDGVTNFRYTPPAGLYEVNAGAFATGATAGGQLNCSIEKNGVAYTTSTTPQTNTSNVGCAVSDLVQTNGTDFIEFFVALNNSSSNATTSTAGVWFSAVKVSN